MKKLVFFLLLFTSFFSLFADSFNERLTNDERAFLKSGDVLIKNINFEKYISLKKGNSEISDELLNIIDKLNPKYLAEVIQYKPYKGNEDLPERLEKVLNNVPDYAGIPYWSARAEKWYDLYESAEIIQTMTDGNKTTIKADLLMDPFDVVHEEINITKSENEILYVATNENLLRYLDKFDCIWPKKMKIAILLFREDDNWVLYGIGGVNAPRIPFFTERIQTSFINRINTFCTFIFKQF